MPALVDPLPRPALRGRRSPGGGAARHRADRACGGLRAASCSTLGTVTATISPDAAGGPDRVRDLHHRRRAGSRLTTPTQTSTMLAVSFFHIDLPYLPSPALSVLCRGQRSFLPNFDEICSYLADASIVPVDGSSQRLKGSPNENALATSPCRLARYVTDPARNADSSLCGEFENRRRRPLVDIDLSNQFSKSERNFPTRHRANQSSGEKGLHAM
jgi:hypothetical protein